MNYADRRNYLIDNFLKFSMMTPENERYNLVLYVDGIGYNYLNNKLVVKDVTEEALEDGNLVIDTVFDSFDAKLSDEIKYSLVTLNLGTITKVNDSAFSECKNLKSVTANKLKTLPMKCFYQCPRLSDVQMSQLVYVREKSFSGCDLSNNFVTGNLTKIDNFAFAYTKVREIKCGKRAEIQCYGLQHTDYLVKFTAESLAWVDSIFYSSTNLNYIDIGYFIDNSCYYDESESLTRFMRRLNLLKVEDAEPYVNEDTKIYNYLFKSKKSKKNEVDMYPYKFNDFYSEFNFLNNLKEFHYKLDNNMSDELQKYYESRMKLIAYKNNAKIVRDV